MKKRSNNFNLIIKLMSTMLLIAFIGISLPVEALQAPLRSIYDGADKKTEIRRSVDDLFATLNIPQLLDIEDARSFRPDIINIGGKELYILSVLQHCGRGIIRFLHDQIADLVLEKPQDWLFIVEMSSDSEQAAIREFYGKDAIIGEAAFAKGLAALLDIPIASPVVGAYDKAVAHRLYEESDIPIETVFQCAVLDQHDLSMQLRHRPCSKEQIHDFISFCSLRWDVEEDLLSRAYEEIMTLRDREPYRVAQVRAVMQAALIDISNSMMFENLQRALQHNQDKNKILIVAGALHTDFILRVIAARILLRVADITDEVSGERAAQESIDAAD